jgi:hypothetical protein
MFAVLFIALWSQLDGAAMKVGILLYLFVSCISCGSIFGLEIYCAGGWLFFAGISFLMLSDALMNFMKTDLLFSCLMHLTFYLSQVLAAASIVFLDNESSEFIS